MSDPYFFFYGCLNALTAVYQPRLSLARTPCESPGQPSWLMPLCATLYRSKSPAAGFETRLKLARRQGGVARQRGTDQ